MIRCSHCGLRFSDPSISSTASSCPNCGRELEPALRKNENLISAYFQDVWTILSRPTEFFQKMAKEGGLGGPLAFALVTHWMGSAAAYLWKAVIGGLMGDATSRVVRIAGSILDMEQTEQWAEMMSGEGKIGRWMWGMGAVIADPFLTLLGVFVGAFFIYLGARILVTPGKNGSPKDLSYEIAVRIVCYAMTPALFYGIPFFGGFVAQLCTVILTIIGAKEIYRIGAGRAIAVALFSKIVLFGFFLGGIGLMVFTFLRMLA